MTPAARTLTQRELNRALLARQLLLERQSLPASDAIERVAGLQAQASSPPFVGLWTRLGDFDEAELQSLIDSREVVRATMMRHTIHFVSARDYIWLRPTIQPALDSNYSGVTRKRLEGFDVQPFLAEARAAFAKRSLTFAEVQAMVEEHHPGADVRAIAYAVRTFLHLVGVPNGSRWRFGGRAPFTLAERWLGRRTAKRRDAQEMVRRYLAAFGPATPADATAWSGVGGMRAVFESMRDELRVFRDEQGRELFDVPGAPLPDPDTKAPPRFLPEFDNTLLGHRDRTRVIADAHRPQLLRTHAWLPGTVLIDGFAAAIWKLEKKRKETTLVIDPFGRIAKRQIKALEPEAEALASFLEPGAKFAGIRSGR